MGWGLKLALMGAKIVDKYKASTTRQMPDENRG